MEFTAGILALSRRDLPFSEYSAEFRRREPALPERPREIALPERPRDAALPERPRDAALPERPRDAALPERPPVPAPRQRPPVPAPHQRPPVPAPSQIQILMHYSMIFCSVNTVSNMLTLNKSNKKNSTLNTQRMHLF